MNSSSFSQSLRENIIESKLTIYDEISIGDPSLWIPSEELEQLLNNYLIGTNLKGLALRTRSKFVKTKVCEALGYPVPKSFKKTKPQFVGQNFDVYSQKSNNLQVWNEGISPSRRYVIIDISESDTIRKIKVVTGDILANLDSTGTLTKKYQATLPSMPENNQLLSKVDTSELQNLTKYYKCIDIDSLPTDYPTPEQLMPIEIIHKKLKPLIGTRIPYLGALQERNRGGILHANVCEKLGYLSFKDDGRFPDIKHQLLEVKLQTSPTIDLGLIEPSSKDFLEIPQIQESKIRMCDVRYVVFDGSVENDFILIKNFYLVTGNDFFNHFSPFEGLKINQKLQIPLPINFFEN